jgi:23S rRNA (cytosine1962-C5)-methyltransferase
MPSRPPKSELRKQAFRRTLPETRGDHEPQILEADEAGPAAIISRRASDKLRAGHLWVYRSDVESIIPALGATEAVAGGLLTLLDSRRIPLGTGLYSASSQLALRKVSAEPRVGRGEYLEDVAVRVRAALALRVPMLDAATDSARLIFAEADDLPGIVVDRYRNLVVLQLLTQGTAHDDLREVLARELAIDGVDVVVERPDPRIRELEKLAAPSAEPLFVREGFAGPAKTAFTLNGLRLHFDANSGQKTGAFLDQRLNYAAAARYAHGEALDICTYQGGFALHMARVCTHVIGVDQSRSALETAEANLELNRDSITADVEWVESDAFELLRAYDAEERKFDTIVLDPPAFAKSKRAAESAMRGYKEMNLRALRMLRPGGTLITCSCSHHVSREEFTATVAEAAADAGRHVRLIETRGAAPDHPEVLTLPETGYLKCLIATVD